MKETKTPGYAGHRFPTEIIAHAVWRYFRFARSYRDVEELLAERGVIVTDETVRQWCQKFGQTNANALRRRRPRPGDTWHLGEVFVSINGTLQHLWRAVDQDGNVLDILVQGRRDKLAAVKFLRKLLKSLAFVARVLITDKLARYGAAKRDVLPGVEHRQHQRLNSRAEISHQPTRERERRMRHDRRERPARSVLRVREPGSDYGGGVARRYALDRAGGCRRSLPGRLRSSRAPSSAARRPSPRPSRRHWSMHHGCVFLLLYSRECRWSLRCAGRIRQWSRRSIGRSSAR